MGKVVINKLVKFIRLLSILIVLSCCCWMSVSVLPGSGWPSLAFAQGKNGSGKGNIKSPGTAPIHIKSDRMEAVDKSGTVYFSGHVEAVRGDLVIHSDKLKVLYKKVRTKTSSGGAKDGSEKKVIEKIIASGHVRITQRDKIATGNKAVYDKSAERITLIGNAQVWQGANRISGEKVIFFINEDRSIVESGKGKRVEAVVYPSE